MEETVADQLVTECQAMAAYALESGLAVPGPALELVHESYRAAPPVRQLAQVHAQLARLVAPATPRTLVLLARERREHGVLRFLGAVRLVRQMMLAGVLLLGTFIATAASPDVNETSGDIFRSSGVELIVNELFLISAAGVGAAFAALFRANRYVAEGTYDPKYESSYWVRFFLGIIAGLVLAVLVPVDAGSQSFTRPLLALVGGFSASVVYRMLSRVVDTLESLVQGEAPEVATAREQIVRARAQEAEGRDRLRVGATLMELRERVRTGAGAEELNAALTGILEELLSAETTSGGEVGRQPPPTDRATVANGSDDTDTSPENG